MTDHIDREIVIGPGTASDGTVVLSGQVYLRAERMPPHNAESTAPASPEKKE